MINYLPRISFLLSFLFITFTSWSNYVLVECEQGYADLSEVDFSDQYARLDGEWEFYYEQLLSPSDLDTINEKIYGQVPGFWKNYDGEYSRFGYATYKLTFSLSSDNLEKGLSFRINNIHNAYSVWLNGELIKKVGKVGVNYEASEPRWLPMILNLEGLKKENEIVIQVCNFRHRNGGIQDAIEIGETVYFSNEYRHQFFSEVFLAGASFVLGCFFIGMFFFWKKDRAALYFGLFSIFFSLRVMLVGTRSIGLTFPDLPWDVLIRAEYIGMFLMHYFMFQFVFYAFEKQTSRVYLNVLKMITLVYVVICLVPGDIFTYLTIPNNYYLLVTFIYCVFIFVKGLKANVPGAIWAILAMALFFLTTIPMVLEYSNLFITDPVLLSVSYIGFMLCMSLVFASRFGFSFTYLESLKNSEEAKRVEIHRQKERIEKNNVLINESINYAKGIQENLLPSDIELRNVFGECFVFFRPEGKVSGDFYWCKQKSNGEAGLMAIADCTGHGVPGAFISIIAISALENIIEKTTEVDTSKLLLELNEVINTRLKGSNKNLGVLKEGLDIGVFRYNYNDKTILYSAAHHNLLVVRNSGKFQLYSGDRHHIGMPVSFDFEFEKYEITLGEGDQIYLFTDGIYDQKGGADGKKLYIKRLIDLILKNRKLPMHRQKIEFEEFMNEWMDGRDQIDDMLLFGMKA